MPIRLVVADDHVEFRADLHLLLKPQPLFVIEGETDDADEAVLLAQRLQPDLLLLDIRFKQSSGLNAIPLIRAVSPGTRILMVSLQNDRRYLIRSVEAGASGYLLKDEVGELLLEAVETVCHGKPFYSPRVYLHGPL